MRNHPVIRELLALQGAHRHELIVRSPDPEFLHRLRRLLSAVDPDLVYWTHDGSRDDTVENSQPKLFMGSLIIRLKEKGLI